MSDQFLKEHRLGLNLRPIYPGQLGMIDSLAHDAFVFSQGKFVKILSAYQGIQTDFIKSLMAIESATVYIHENDFKLLSERLKDKLLKLSRSLSIGDPLKNGAKHTHLLSLQMANLYNDPYNDELLHQQFQSGKNLSSLLLDNKSIHRQLYKTIGKQGHHYVIAQPLLSSILLLSFLQNLGLFSEKEIQSLFMTSYFKDIGMSFIPREKFEMAILSDFDKKIFSEHAQNSMKILSGRTPLSPQHLELIKNHHYLNYKIQSLAGQSAIGEDQHLIMGLESTLLCAVDILVAMTNERPYRKASSIFQALELLKRVLSDDHPQEFRSLVMFLKQFFGK